jgi:hypothetical protein
MCELGHRIVCARRMLPTLFRCGAQALTFLFHPSIAHPQAKSAGFEVAVAEVRAWPLPSLNRQECAHRLPFRLSPHYHPPPSPATLPPSPLTRIPGSFLPDVSLRTQAKALIGGFTDPGPLQAGGVHMNGVKYMYLRSQDTTLCIKKVRVSLHSYRAAFSLSLLLPCSVALVCALCASPLPRRWCPPPAQSPTTTHMLTHSFSLVRTRSPSSLPTVHHTGFQRWVR